MSPEAMSMEQELASGPRSSGGHRALLIAGVVVVGALLLAGVVRAVWSSDGSGTHVARRRTPVTTPAQLPGAVPKSASDLRLTGQPSGRYVAQSARCGPQGFRAVGELGGTQVLMV